MAKRTATTSTGFETREAWLQAFAEAVRPWFEEIGVTVPPVRIGVGFTSKGARSSRIGECWAATASEDGTPQVFIHPGQRTAEDVAHVLVHELIHAAIGTDKKHGPEFKKIAVPLGLTGKMTATVAGPDLVLRLAPVLADLGPYPHAGLTPTGTTSTGPKQTTRMLKCECPACGYTVRTTRKWLDIATPTCPLDEIPMEVPA